MNGIARALLAIVFLFMAGANAADSYVTVGHTTDIKCPAHLKLEGGFAPNPEFTVSPDQALVVARIRCPNKLEITVFADSENYYITTLGLKPGTVGTHVVNGKTGSVSFQQSK
jgi:hypothetical protein